MSNVILHSGEDVAAAAERFISAWEQAERGAPPTLPETHIVFESWAGLAAVLTPKRVELLRHIHRHPAATVAGLATVLAREPELVAKDVDELAAAGLIDRTGDRLRADYAEIHTAIAL